ncbi:Morn repeat protein [Pandoravirus kuranda]|uniref:Morn repeat protein n=1 Tax=Pandoravirus kuranda TaxID=3019033 RepID=A0AA95EEY4_9VIRU|nr:Morn repeat protein [Pandoravirus kuranda]
MGGAAPDNTLCDAVDSTFSLLPDEIVLGLLRVLGTPDVAARAACVSRRLARLAADPALWQHFHALHHGNPLHKHFAAFNKDWRWLCRARSCRRCKTPTRYADDDNTNGAVAKGACSDKDEDTDCGHVRLADKHFYWGDLRAGAPHGYGLHMSVKPGRNDKTEHACACALLAQVPSAAWTVHYEGQWHEGQHHGRGFSAMLGDSQRCEIGSVHDKRRYEGEFVHGKLHGQGRLVWDDGSTFDGSFRDGTRHTPGVYVWPNGNRYEGEWAHVERHGQGTFTWTKGGYSLRCSWRANRSYGWGVCTWGNGQCLEALWDGRVPRDDGIFVAPDGRRFIDTANEIFIVGRAAIADDVDPQGEWGGRFRRLREIRDGRTDVDDGHPGDRVDALSVVKVIEATYPDYSRVLSKWKRGGAVSREVVFHSVACDRIAREEDEGATGERHPVSRCMACLYAAS